MFDYRFISSGPIAVFDNQSIPSNPRHSIYERHMFLDFLIDFPRSHEIPWFPHNPRRHASPTLGFQNDLHLQLGMAVVLARSREGGWKREGFC